jgi:hypothetical protein
LPVQRSFVSLLFTTPAAGPVRGGTARPVGVISQNGLHAWLDASCLPWCVVMIVAMLFRLLLIEHFLTTVSHAQSNASETEPRHLLAVPSA